MTVTLAEAPVVLRRDVVDALRLATREAVNVGALDVTTDAREGVRAVLGPEQRMSRLTVRLRPDKGVNVRQRISLATVAAGGTRINPYYRQADSTTRPVALVGARGPAQLIEHDRRGGYDVRAGRKGLDARFAQAAAEAEGRAFGRTAEEVTATAARLQRPGAIPTPSGYFAHVRPGPIRRPRGGPITKAFKRATTTIDRHAADVIDKRMTTQLRAVGGGVGGPVGTVIAGRF